MNKQDKIEKVMKEFENGTLKTSSGKKVTSRKQALAIALSESEGYSEKADLINQINISSVQQAEDILKSAGSEDLFEKAKHQDGDEHPNGKWVWVSSANGGKGDWRTKGGRTHSKHSAGGGNSEATTTTQQQKQTQVTGTTKKISSDKEEILNDKNKSTVGDASKLTAPQKSMVDKVMDKGFLMANSKYNDKSKVELKKTDKGNWRCYYNGKDIGVTLDKMIIGEKTAKQIGWYKEETKSTANPVSEKKTESKTSTAATTPQMIRKESNRVNGNVEITYSSIPFVDDKNGNAKFVIKKTNNGNYYVPSSPFLGHETPDVKKRFDETFYSPGSIEDIEGRIKTFTTWLSKEHPYSALKDIKDFNEKSKVRTMVEMYRIKDNRSLRKTISNISSSDVDEIKKRILDEFNDAFDDNVKSDAVGYRFRIYR